MEEIAVSAYCLVYNHEKYLRKCLDGFVMQKTNFKFEVIVHDDASTDHSADIIREYEQKYPEIIKPIYQKENQYSKHVGIIKRFILPKVRGKYLAICEGDDYWSDENKLQLQYERMEQNPDCHFCVHKVTTINEAGAPLDKVYPAVPVKEGRIPTENFMKIIGEQYSFQTSSYFLRAEEVKAYVDNPPEFKKVADVGDVPMTLHFGRLGSVCYIDRAMSCYRMSSIGSWSSRQKADAKKQLAHCISMVKMYDAFNAETGDKYKEALMPRWKEYYLGKCVFSLENRESARILLKKENRDFLNRYNIKFKIYVILMAYTPWLANLYYKLKGKK